MGKENLGQPSGTNKSDKGTGVPSNITPENIEQNREMTEKYITEDNEISDSIRTNNPNRNTDKEDATNAGGYVN